MFVKYKKSPFWLLRFINIYDIYTIVGNENVSLRVCAEQGKTLLQ